MILSNISLWCRKSSLHRNIFDFCGILSAYHDKFSLLRWNSFASLSFPSVHKFLYQHHLYSSLIYLDALANRCWFQEAHNMMLDLLILLSWVMMGQASQKRYSFHFFLGASTCLSNFPQNLHTRSNWIYFCWNSYCDLCWMILRHFFWEFYGSDQSSTEDFLEMSLTTMELLDFGIDQGCQSCFIFCYFLPLFLDSILLFWLKTL